MEIYKMAVEIAKKKRVSAKQCLQQVKDVR